jgi:Divergent InlB B-repeat domain
MKRFVIGLALLGVITSCSPDSGRVGGAEAQTPVPVGEFVSPAQQLAPGTYTVPPDAIHLITVLPHVTLSAGPNGDQNGMVSGMGNYWPGATVTLTADPGAGSMFLGWSGDSVCAPTFVMPPTNVKCIATFSAPLDAKLLGNTTVDLAGPSQLVGPSGVMDNHIQITGVLKTVSEVKILRNNQTGIWVSPPNGANWTAITQITGSTIDVFFEPTRVVLPTLDETPNYCVLLTYTDGTAAALVINEGRCS